MKFIHLSDLHLGKKLGEFDLIEDQKYITDRIFDIIDSEKPDAVIIAGDIYDRGFPPLDAINLFDDIIVRLAGKKIESFIISGNHDSAERNAFANRLIDLSGIHLSSVYNGNVKPLTLKDSHGDVNFWMLPFIKPATVRNFFPDEEIASYTDAVKVAVKNMNADFSSRNILIAHQFVTGSERCDSEDVSVGGSDNVDAAAFDGFDYVALGHLHGAQSAGRETIRYCGTPLKYSLSEINHEKSVTVVEIGEKDDVRIRTVPLAPMRDIVEITGSYNEIISQEFSSKLKKDDFYKFILTDEENIVNVMNRVRTVYPNVIKIDYTHAQTVRAAEFSSDQNVGNLSMLDNFKNFYRSVKGEELSERQTAYLTALIEKIEEEENETA
jgi:exonuclease SbcD